MQQGGILMERSSSFRRILMEKPQKEHACTYGDKRLNVIVIDQS
jgi:hypothetical protein